MCQFMTKVAATRNDGRKEIAAEDERQNVINSDLKAEAVVNML